MGQGVSRFVKWVSPGSWEMGWRCQASSEEEERVRDRNVLGMPAVLLLEVQRPTLSSVCTVGFSDTHGNGEQHWGREEYTGVHFFFYNRAVLTHIFSKEKLSV